MGEHEFLKLLTRVIKLYNDVRIYNTGYTRFSYDLTERNGELTLTIHYPLMGNCATVTYDTKQYDDFISKMNQAEEYLDTKLKLSKQITSS